ncbi:peptidylprolyl isomerase [Streptomyces sp. XD-27]|uniref:peptidylprolyl isomerase n=1 Tax=Streptomyces sp. XD-27 TaxID=3062779 RepID=UPI0026F41626|nr:peptidylprolyl isomerase [Streptomyces sp. XD-27]WKX73436.1 peptidylprolyl isomerase [Streptomyces sp. XD-27]
MVSNEQRRKQLAREKFARQQQRRESARRKVRQRNVVIASSLAAVLAVGAVATAAGAFSGDDKSSDSAVKPTPTPTPSAPKPKPEPKMAVDKKAKYTMSLKTNQGDLTIAMDAAKTPHTVNSFKHLADKGFFDGTKCHRLVAMNPFVLQCGDPEGTGMGGPGYTIPDENLAGLGTPDKKKGTVKYPAGTVAMANTGQPHSGGSQFFIVYKDSELPPSYTPFGTVDDAGLKAVQDIAKGGLTPANPQYPDDGAPKKTVTISKATVEKD